MVLRFLRRAFTMFFCILVAMIGTAVVKRPTRVKEMPPVPQMMFAAIAVSPGVIKVLEVPTPVPSKGEVLIKFHAAPMNPVDIVHATTTSLVSDPFPHSLGIEGSGVVVASGGGIYGNFLVGLRVAASARIGQSWAQYGIAHTSELVPLPDDVTFEEGASAFVNPMTVMAMLQIASEGRYPAIVQTAAASQLGQQMVRMAAKRKLTVINVVRRPEQVELLSSIGAQHILLSTDSDFEEKLRNLAQKFDARLAFDAVGGETASAVIRALPRSSEIYMFADLSHGDFTGIRNEIIMRQDKQIKGLHLSTWVPRQSFTTLIWNLWQIMSHIKTDLRTSYSTSYSLRDVPCAFHKYSTQSKTSNKPLIKPNEITEFEDKCE